MQKNILKHEEMCRVFVTKILFLLFFTWIWSIRQICSGEPVTALVRVVLCCLVQELAIEKAEAASVQTLSFLLWKLFPDHETCLHCRILKQIPTSCLLSDNQSSGEVQIGLQLRVFWLFSCRMTPFLVWAVFWGVMVFLFFKWFSVDWIILLSFRRQGRKC